MTGRRRPAKDGRGVSAMAQLDLGPCPECGAIAQYEDWGTTYATDGEPEMVRVRCLDRHVLVMPRTWPIRSTPATRSTPLTPGDPVDPRPQGAGPGQVRTRRRTPPSRAAGPAAPSSDRSDTRPSG